MRVRPRTANSRAKRPTSCTGSGAIRHIAFSTCSSVWEFCQGRGELYPRLTPEQDERLRARFIPEVEALEELLMIDLSAWKKPRSPRSIETSPAPRLQRLANG